MAADYTHITTWLFDLDDCLYPPESGLHAAMRHDGRVWAARHLGMTVDEADALFARYNRDYGAAFKGLAQRDDFDMAAFIREVFGAVDMSPLSPNPALKQALAALPGRRGVFTTSPRIHVERVLAAQGLADLFDDSLIFDIERVGFETKPSVAAYDQVIREVGCPAAQCVFVEDRAANLVPAKARGMMTVLVNQPAMPEDCAHIDDYAPTLLAWLQAREQEVAHG